MWIFGYGSLMGDGWDAKYGSMRRSVATLVGYRRSFNKSSIKNWGNRENPGVTLNLEKCEEGVCTGVAFEFPEERSQGVRDYLLEREGKSFPLIELPVRLDDGSEVFAHIPVYTGKNLLRTMTTQELARIVLKARGQNGSCIDYVKSAAELLAGLGINDPAVAELWTAIQDQYTQSVTSEIRERIELLEANLPKQLDGFAISPYSKLPFKALLYREVLIWRMAELSRSALEQINKEKLVSAVMLVRASLETSAALWYLHSKLASAVVANSTGGLDDYLMRLVMGSKNNPDLPAAINVLNFVDSADKEIQGLRQQYDALSEIANPNWAGTSLLYSKSDPQNLCTNFGANIRESETVAKACVLNLSVALMMFERTYEQTGEIMPSFVMLCERQLASTAGDGSAAGPPANSPNNDQS